MTVSRSIPVAENIALFFSFLLLSNIPLNICTTASLSIPLFIHLSDRKRDVFNLPISSFPCGNETDRPLATIQESVKIYRFIKGSAGWNHENKQVLPTKESDYLFLSFIALTEVESHSRPVRTLGFKFVKPIFIETCCSKRS